MSEEREAVIATVTSVVLDFQVADRRALTRDYEIASQLATRIYEEAIEAAREQLKTGMAELGFIVGRNPEGVDDSIDAVLLIVREQKAEREQMLDLLERWVECGVIEAEDSDLAYDTHKLLGQAGRNQPKEAE